ncbi:MAG: hypothetical protein JRH11_13900, partial [Deltaproteobacteria bacterium]|nr:hypothetical protein [Deltaproteobacteria bacterium]
DVATSSAYRDQRVQVQRLVDGDLESAWNSRSDDLVGAWVDVRLPDDVTVTSIQMTVGYTKANATRDLFTANQRIARVRVLHDGDEVVVHPLDIASRQLQSIPVAGGGGVYRIELVELTTGEREDWQEACISELRVMGHASGSQGGARLPRFAIGALPEPAGEAEAVDRDAVRRLAHRRVAWFQERWSAYEYALNDFQSEELVGEVDPSTRVELRRERNEILEKVVEVVQPVDGARADQVRIAMMSDEGGLAASTAAFHSVADWLADDAERCWIAKTLAHVRLTNTLRGLRREAELSDRDEYEAMEMGEEGAGGGGGPDFYGLIERIEDIELAWGRNGRGGATHLSRIEMPAVAAGTKTEWDALTAELAVARPACGWE